MTWWYPVFINSIYLGDMPLAEVPGVCPALFSQSLVIEWKVIIDGERQEVRGTSNGKKWAVPFKRDGTPYVPLCDVKSTFNPSVRVPPKFRLK